MNDTPIEITARLLSQRLALEPDLVLIDCREENEFAIASIARSVLMPMSCWADHLEKLRELIGKEIVVHCHHGVRSLRVTHWLRANGFPNAKSLAGGIDAWSVEVDPTVPRY